MVRDYIRKTGRGADGAAYSQEDLQAAIEDVKNANKTARGAAKFYGIPRSTLRHHLDGTRGQRGSPAGNGAGGGRATALGKVEEDQLASALKTLEKWGFGLSQVEVCDVVQMHVKSKGIESRFPEGRPGADWMMSFRKRHNLSVKKPQGIEYVRCNQNNPFTIYGFYDLLSATLDELQLQDKPHLIYNCDETSFSNDPSKTKVVGAVGQKSTRMISSSGRENTTVLMCVSAAGQKVPPLCVFKGKHILESWLSTDDIHKTSFAASKRGWMDSTIFCNWFTKCFIPSLPDERPVLLVYDGHVSHVSLDVIKTARDANIHILKLPPHTTHILQPLDVSVFKSLKVRWDKALCKWQRANPRKRLPKNEFAKLINQIYDELPEEVIINGFKSTGIYDANVKGANSLAVPTDIFKPSDLTRYRQSQKAKQQDKISNDSHETESHSNDTPQDHIERVTTEIQEVSEQKNIKEPSTSSTTASLEEKSFEQIIIEYIQHDKMENKNTAPKRKRICFGAAVITSDQFLKEKEKLARESTNKNTKEQKPPAKKKTKISKKTTLPIVSSSESEYDEEDVVEPESNDENDVITVTPGDFVAVTYDNNQFPGKVLEVTDDQVKVTHMERSGYKGWRWPQTEDVLWYAAEHILKIIPPPKPANRRGLYTVTGIQGLFV